MVGPNAVELRSRAGNEITLGYPELQPLARALGPTMAVLDGEIVAIDEQGRSNFQRLQSRMHLRDAATVARIASQVPVTFMIFDRLGFEGVIAKRSPAPVCLRSRHHGRPRRDRSTVR